MLSEAVFGWFGQGIPNNWVGRAKLILFNSLNPLILIYFNQMYYKETI